MTTILEEHVANTILVQKQRKWDPTFSSQRFKFIGTLIPG